MVVKETFKLSLFSIASIRSMLSANLASAVIGSFIDFITASEHSSSFMVYKGQSDVTWPENERIKIHIHLFTSPFKRRLKNHNSVIPFLS